MILLLIFKIETLIFGFLRVRIKKLFYHLTRFDRSDIGERQVEQQSGRGRPRQNRFERQNIFGEVDQEELLLIPGGLRHAVSSTRLISNIALSLIFRPQVSPGDSSREVFSPPRHGANLILHG